MKRILWIALMVVGVGCAWSGAQAGWSTCLGCHNGGIAPNKDHLLAKFKTVDALIKGAQAADNPMMARIKQDIEDLTTAASDLGLSAEKDAQ